MECIRKQNGHFMPLALLVKPSGLTPQGPYTQLYFPLNVGLRFN